MSPTSKPRLSIERVPHEFTRLLKSSSMTPAELQKIIDHPQLFESMLRTMRAHSNNGEPFPAVEGFADALEQIAHMRTWSACLGWGVVEEQLLEVGENVPAWPKNESVALVLAIYFSDGRKPDGTFVSAVDRTFDELWRAVCLQAPDVTRSECFENRGGEYSLTLARDIALPPIVSGGGPVLRWELIDMESSEGAFDMSDPLHWVEPGAVTFPGAGALAAVAHHADWFRSRFTDPGQGGIPFCLPGYRLYGGKEGGRWLAKPVFVRTVSGHGFSLTYDSCRYVTIPRFYRRRR